MTPRTPILILLGLVTVPLLHCTSDEQALPPFQTVALEVAGGDLSRFKGRWFDAMDGYLVAKVQGGERPRFSLRLPPEVPLEWARLEGEDLLFRMGVGERGRTLSLHPYDPYKRDQVVVVRPGEGPSWCGTCTPFLERNRSLLAVARLHGGRAVETFGYAYERSWDWLVDVL